MSLSSVAVRGPDHLLCVYVWRISRRENQRRDFLCQKLNRAAIIIDNLVVPLPPVDDTL